RLMRAFRRLLAGGHSLLVIEHNLDVIRASDWIIDLGPDGGEQGGRLMGAGTPEDLMGITESHTGRALKEYAESIVREADTPAMWAEPAATYSVDVATAAPDDNAIHI